MTELYGLGPKSTVDDALSAVPSNFTGGQVYLTLKFAGVPVKKISEMSGIPIGRLYRVFKDAAKRDIKKIEFLELFERVKQGDRLALNSL